MRERAPSLQPPAVAEYAAAALAEGLPFAGPRRRALRRLVRDRGVVVGVLVLVGVGVAAAAAPLLAPFAPNAPHRAGLLDPIPAPRDRGVCADTAFPLPANFNAHDQVSEPGWMAGESPKSAATAVRMRRATCETLRGVDDAISAILDALRGTGRLDNTYVVVTSDNGYHFGEHRLLEKGDLYDESIRVPLLVRGPGVTAANDGRLTSNIDLAPTFLD